MTASFRPAMLVGAILFLLAGSKSFVVSPSAEAVGRVGASGLAVWVAAVLWTIAGLWLLQAALHLAGRRFVLGVALLAFSLVFFLLGAAIFRSGLW